MSENKNQKTKHGGSSHVRFTPREYSQVQKESFKKSKSIPTLLKDTYFKGRPEEVLISESDLEQLNKKMDRIGNNLNQVAKKLNSGFMHGWNETLGLVYEQFRILTVQLHHGYGVYKG
ncbi:MAG: plasmid mobilization relaxosome protein MobC [Bdellovibrionota bacterium]|nr:plasmid mobilization relaxosome protein MobC [Bdellovibrionota bacterium]